MSTSSYDTIESDAAPRNRMVSISRGASCVRRRVNPFRRISSLRSQCMQIFGLPKIRFRVEIFTLLANVPATFLWHISVARLRRACRKRYNSEAVNWNIKVSHTRTCHLNVSIFSVISFERVATSFNNIAQLYDEIIFEIRSLFTSNIFEEVHPFSVTMCYLRQSMCY